MKIVAMESEISQRSLGSPAIVWTIIGQGTQAEMGRTAQGEDSHHLRDAAPGATFNKVVLETQRTSAGDVAHSVLQLQLWGPNTLL